MYVSKITISEDRGRDIPQVSRKHQFPYLVQTAAIITPTSVYVRAQAQEYPSSLIRHCIHETTRSLTRTLSEFTRVARRCFVSVSADCTVLPNFSY